MSLTNPSLEAVYCSNLASDYGIIRFIRFVSRFTGSSRNAFLFRLDLSLHAGAGIFVLEFWFLELNGPRLESIQFKDQSTVRSGSIDSSDGQWQENNAQQGRPDVNMSASCTVHPLCALDD